MATYRQDIIGDKTVAPYIVRSRDWCKEQAQGLVPEEHGQFDVVGDMWMDQKLRHGIARLFAQGPRGKQELPFKDVDVPSLVQKLPAARDCEYLEDEGGELVSFCIESVGRVHELWNEGRKKKKAAGEEVPLFLRFVTPSR
ncbi:hypothetical protein B0T24DRAFT_685285 [Lasiosphaeria ovina]|uniref:Uncharacterized protein n=1 Tax=Lasiosphaeria ovina TaxID=92902 RepID=A0AAE0JSC7_9PEZI|nr:hypothetical protein B0T24DRAFT_685285 [Lasiosphaeria ovina]